jgi:hypothetical protein
MPKSPLDDVVAHWHKLIESLSTSSKDFYDEVEAGLSRRNIPGLKTSRVKWSEGGILTPDREYLRVTGDRHSFDMCAAPFGTGYFFSSWVTKKQARFVVLYLIAFALLTLFISWLLQQAANFGWRGSSSLELGILLGLLRLVVNPFVLIPFSFVVVLWLIAVAARVGNNGPEAAILTVPLVGWFYGRFFAPETYYQIDTMLMFQSAVHTAMLEVIDGLLSRKGMRALAAEERKPVFRELLFSGGAGLAPIEAMHDNRAAPSDSQYLALPGGAGS